MMGLFGKKKDPKEQVREMQRKMRGEMRALDRQVYAIQREEQKVTKEIKEAAKKGDREVCVVLAKSLLQSRKAVAKIHMSKAQINSVIMCMQEQLATMRMAGSLQKSTQVLQSMQNLVKVPEIMKTMREMAQEMMKLGIIDEMIEETMETMEPEDLEEQAQEEVDRILWEVTAGELGKAPAAVTGDLGGGKVAAEAEDFESMAQRLAELRD
uniref:Snf7 domain containing protein n=1 Tax=Haemonchus contortus TaxID=6289 RepID=W6NIT7_HAECO